MEFNFTGKKILVTGAGKGIGRGIAIALAKSGCKVYALSRTKSTLDTLVEEFPDIIPIAQDLMNWDETRAKLENLEDLDGLVNNAAIAEHLLPANDITKDQLDSIMQNNLYSAINCTQVISRKMIASGKKGSIVNVSSVLGQLGYPHTLAYGMAKAALDRASKQFALELGPHNIRVNSVNISLVMTDMVVNAMETTGLRFYDDYLERTPMNRNLTVDEAVAPILYFLSDASSMVTGTLHFVDAGLSCNITTKK